MEHTKFTANLPTRTALRKAANRTRAAIGGHARPSVAAMIAATAAVAAVVAGAATVGFALVLVMATLPAHPVALLAAAFVTTFALYTVPLLTLRAVARATCAARATA